MKKILVCNMKMKLLPHNLGKYLKDLESYKDNKLILCPSTIYIPFFLSKGYNVGVQNISNYEDLNHTDCLSVYQVKELGIKYSLIGHLDYRDYEDDTIINKKIHLAIKNGITPIICIGETSEEKKMFKTEKILKKQIISALRDNIIDKVILVYDPLWTITSKDKKDIEEIVSFIKNIVDLNFKYANIQVFCGGITSNNIDILSDIKVIDGFLTSSIDVSCISKIIEVI